MLARSEEFDAYQMLGENYAGIRRWAPAFLGAFVFQGVPAAAALMRAIDLLRDMNRGVLPSLPKSAPIGFIRERWARHVLRGGSVDRRYYDSACCRNCAIVCAPATSGWWAAGDIAPSRNA
ncbi:MAG TPA: hypothetical protein VHT21_08145 [Stellaceae bacterium]|nr:hypothetical protein [Stellaceae bacterium]